MASPSLQSLLQTSNECHQFLDAEGIAHVRIGGLAVWLHGYKRETGDVDLLVHRDDWHAIQTLFASRGFEQRTSTIFVSPEGVKVSFRYGGTQPKKFDAYLPDPANPEFHTAFVEVPGMAVFADRLELMKHKLECGILGQRRGGKWIKRSMKHFKDVIGLVICNDLLPS